MKGGDKMDILAARSLRALLAVTLVANCCLPCYTLAYADDAGASDDSGAAPSDGQGSPVVYDVEPSSDFPLVESGDGGADDSYGGFGDDDASISLGSQLDSSSSSSGTSGSSSSDGDLYSSDLVDSSEVNYDELIDAQIALPAVPASILTALDWIGVATSTAAAVDTFVSWFSGPSDQVKLLKALIATSGANFGMLREINEWAEASYSVQVDTRNYSRTYLPMIEGMRDLLRSQWGYGYGGTAIIQKSSPAWYLQLAANRLNYNGSLTGGDPDDYSAARLLARIHNSQYGSITYTETGNTGVRSTIGVLGYVANLLYQNNLYSESATTRLHYVGGLVGEEGSGDYSAARLLARIHNGLYGSITYSETGNTGVRSAISVLGYIANLVYQGDQYLLSATTRLHYKGPLSGVDGEDDYSVARLLARIHNYLYSISNRYDVLDAITKGPEGGRVSLYNIGNSIETIKNETRDLDNLLESIYDRLDLSNEISRNNLSTNETSLGLLLDLRALFGNNNQMLSTIHYDLSLLRHGVADTLPGYVDYTIWDWLHDIYICIDNLDTLLIGIQKTLTAWGNRWDSQDQYFIEWAKRWDALDKSPVDLSETNKLLGLLTADVASIRDKYVVGDSLSDMFGALVGDLQVPATAAAIDGIKGAMSTAFPFCIPSVVNLVLFGSVVADPQAPVWEFDIAGSPLVVDFAPYEDFAEVCRWTVRLLFVAALLLNTRKFVYGMGGAY